MKDNERVPAPGEVWKLVNLADDFWLGNTVRVVRQVESGRFYCLWEGGPSHGKSICRDIPRYELGVV